MVTAINTHPPITTKKPAGSFFFAVCAHCATCNIVHTIFASDYGEALCWIQWLTFFDFGLHSSSSVVLDVHFLPCPFYFSLSPSDSFPQFIFILRFFLLSPNCISHMEIHRQLTTPHTYNNCKISILLLFTWMNAENSFGLNILFHHSISRGVCWSLFLLYAHTFCKTWRWGSFINIFFSPPSIRLLSFHDHVMDSTK